MKRQFYVDCYNDSASVTAGDDFYIPPHETKSPIKGYFMRWITVAERLPETEGFCCVTLKYAGICRTGLAHYSNGAWEEMGVIQELVEALITA